MKSLVEYIALNYENTRQYLLICHWSIFSSAYPHLIRAGKNIRRHALVMGGFLKRNFRVKIPAVQHRQEPLKGVTERIFGLLVIY